jgi:ribosomal protein L11 methyltransferase
MYRTSFRSLEDEREALLDALLPLLPTGVREGFDTVTVISGAPLDRAALEAAAGFGLEGWTVEEVPADWRHRRGEEGVLIGGRVCIRSPFDPPPAEGIVDIVVERRGSSSFGSGSHPTTQMCVSLMLELTPDGAAADLGCGVGTLAIVASKLGWAPVVGVDRVPVAIEVGRENVERNGVEVSLSVADLAVDHVPVAPLMLVNAPPPVHERLVASLREAPSPGARSGPAAAVRHVIASGLVADEVPAVVRAYQSAGFEVAQALGTEDEWIALRLSC